MTSVLGSVPIVSEAPVATTATSESNANVIDYFAPNFCRSRSQRRSLGVNWRRGLSTGCLIGTRRGHKVVSKAELGSEASPGQGDTSKRPPWEGLKQSALWSGPPEIDPNYLPPHPVLGTVVAACLQNYYAQNMIWNDITKSLFEDTLPNSTLHYDYIEFRTFAVDGFGVDHIGDFFMEYGYEPKELVSVPDSNVWYRWYSPPQLHAPELPRVVVSEIEVSKLPQEAQDVVKKYTEEWRLKENKQIAALVGMGMVPWGQPTLEEFAAVYDASEFASWVLVNGYNIVCASISVHNIRNPLYKFGMVPDPVDIDRLVDIINDNAVILNSSGEDVFDHPFIKRNNEGTIRQFATVAECNSFTFADGKSMHVPGGYMAFTERKVLPEFEDEADGGTEERHRYDGVDPIIMQHMLLSTETAVPCFAKLEAMELEVKRRVEADGKKLTGEWTKQDRKVAEPYMKQLAAELQEAEARGTDGIDRLQELLNK